MNSTNHLTESDIAGYLDQDLDADARRRIEAHLDRCAECRSELIETRRLANGKQSIKAVPRSRRRWWIPAAVAAGVAGLLLLRPGSPTAPTSTAAGPLERPAPGPSESMPRIDVVTPVDGATIAPHQVRFQWRSRAADSYRVTLLTETGEPLWTEETSDTALTLPATITLEVGRLYFWRVDAVADGVSATTGIHKFEVTP